MAKNKMKTHKGLSKVCTVRPGGTVKMGVAASNHKTGSKSAASKRTKRKGNTMSSSDIKRVKSVLAK